MAKYNNQQMIFAALKGDNGTTWFTGTTAPDNSTGVNGDFYLNTATKDLYEKKNNTWTNICTLGGDGGSSNSNVEVINLGTIQNTGTLDSQVLTTIKNNLNSKGIIYKAYLGSTIGYACFSQAVFSETYLILNGVLYLGEPTLMILQINLSNGIYAAISSPLLEKKEYTISAFDFTEFKEGETATISLEDATTLEQARVDKAKFVYNGTDLLNYFVLYNEVGDDFRLLCYFIDHGIDETLIVSVNTANCTATILKVLKHSINNKNDVVNLGTIDSTKTEYESITNLLTEKGYARVYFNIEGFLDQENGVGNEGYYEAYVSGEDYYFASTGKLYKYIVDTSTQGFHVEEVSNQSSSIKKNKNLIMLNGTSIFRSKKLTEDVEFGIILGANFHMGSNKPVYEIDNKRMNFIPYNMPTFTAGDHQSPCQLSDILTTLFTYRGQKPVVTTTQSPAYIPFLIGQGANNVNPHCIVLDISGFSIGDHWYRELTNLPKRLRQILNGGRQHSLNDTLFRFRLSFVTNYEVENTTSGGMKWKGDLQNSYYDILLFIEISTMKIFAYPKIRKFK